MSNLSRLAAGFVEAPLRCIAVRQVALRLAEKRRRSMVLVYHRLCLEDAEPQRVVRALPVAILTRQLELLSEIGDIVRLDTLLESDPSDRIRFAITFDDDDLSHVTYALPTLQRAGVSATFFVSARGLHGLAPYWWDLLEHNVRRIGLERTTSLLRPHIDVTGGDLESLAAVLEHSPLSTALDQVLPWDGASPRFDASDIKTLAAAGMTIGFHTVRHPVMTALSDPELERALTEGRAELSSLLQSPVTLLAYPYGRADLRVASAAGNAGYRAAFRSGGRPIGHPRNPFLLPRWDPGFLTERQFLAALAARLHRHPLPRSHRAVASASF